MLMHNKRQHSGINLISQSVKNIVEGVKVPHFDLWKSFEQGSQQLPVKEMD